MDSARVGQKLGEFIDSVGVLERAHELPVPTTGHVINLVRSLGHWSFVRIVQGMSKVVTVCASWSLKFSTRFSIYDCCESETVRP